MWMPLASQADEAAQAGLLLVALGLAWAVDLGLGEPRNAWHPVAWLGRLVGPLGHRIKALPPRAALFAGGAAWWAAALGLGGSAWAVQVLMAPALPATLSILVLTLVLKPTFAWRMLHDEVASVERSLIESDLSGARLRLSWLVSRDVSQLDATAIRETAIETLAENLSDSLTAPLFWFAVAGLPGAVIYRLANLLDAMWGYRGEWEWAGKWAARADDVLSWLPARLTACLLMPVRLAAWRVLPAEARCTASPNGGWPMGAMALRLGVRLSKPAVYELNGAGRPPAQADLQLGLRYAQNAAWMSWGLAMSWLLARAMW